MSDSLTWMDGKCQNCEYGIPFVNGKKVQIRIECWRFPPEMHVVPPHNGPFIHYNTKYPEVDEQNTCGEYKYIKRRQTNEIEKEELA